MWIFLSCAILAGFDFYCGEANIAYEFVNFGGVSTMSKSVLLWLASMPGLWLRWANGHANSVLMKILELG